MAITNTSFMFMSIMKLDSYVICLIIDISQ